MAAKRGRPPKKEKAKSTQSKKRSAKTKNQVENKNTPWWEQYSFTRSELIRRAILFVLLVYVVLNYRGLLIAATVNGEPVSRLGVISQLEQTSGASVLDNKINEMLIRQKARESHVNVTDEDINAAIADIETNVLGEGQSIDDVLALQGMTRDDLIEQIEIQVMVEKLLEGDVTVSDEEVNQYVESNRESINEENTEEDLRDFARQQIRQQKLAQRFGTWIQELRDAANINYYVEY